MSPKRSRSRRRRGRLLALTLFVLLLALAGGFTYLAAGAVLGDKDEQVEQTGEPVRVEIPPGLSAREVARVLEREGVIDSAWLFSLRLRINRATDNLKPGSYVFRRGEDFDQLLAQLQEGAEPPTVRVTLPEGFSIDQTALRLSENDLLDGEEYARLATQPERFSLPLVGGQPPEVETLEGLLFPDTYFLPADQGVDHLIRAQLAAFEKQTGALPWAAATELGVTPYEVLIVASLIEKEARVAEERPLVAAVIYNRLGKDMALGIDATTRYALKKWGGPLTKRDLDVDSPYNTRRRKGLPPGPIASPGRAALEAALAPTEVDYLYYVLQDDQGHHFFTASYEEFLKAKQSAPAQ